MARESNMSQDETRTVRTIKGRDRAEFRRSYCAPSLAKGPMLAAVTSSIGLVSGNRGA
jgi:hypothetical protein